MKPAARARRKKVLTSVASKRGRASRRKGHDFERGMVHELREVYGAIVRRGLGQARAANEVPDIDGTPFWLELKHHHRPNIPAALAQAARDSGGRRPPMAITRATNGPVIVSLRFEDFVRLVLDPTLKPAWCEDCALAPTPGNRCPHGICRNGLESPRF